MEVLTQYGLAPYQKRHWDTDTETHTHRKQAQGERPGRAKSGAMPSQAGGCWPPPAARRRAWTSFPSQFSPSCLLLSHWILKVFFSLENRFPAKLRRSGHCPHTPWPHACIASPPPVTPSYQSSPCSITTEEPTLKVCSPHWAHSECCFYEFGQTCSDLYPSHKHSVTQGTVTALENPLCSA